jgi:hypothetical protein
MVFRRTSECRSESSRNLRSAFIGIHKCAGGELGFKMNTQAPDAHGGRSTRSGVDRCLILAHGRPKRFTNGMRYPYLKSQESR